MFHTIYCITLRHGIWSVLVDGGLLATFAYRNLATAFVLGLMERRRREGETSQLIIDEPPSNEALYPTTTGTYPN